MCTFLFGMVHGGIWNRCIVGSVRLTYYVYHITLWDLITYPCPRYLLVTPKSSHDRPECQVLSKVNLHWNNLPQTPLPPSERHDKAIITQINLAEMMKLRWRYVAAGLNHLHIWNDGYDRSFLCHTCDSIKMTQTNEAECDAFEKIELLSCINGDTTGAYRLRPDHNVMSLVVEIISN